MANKMFRDRSQDINRPYLLKSLRGLLCDSNKRLDWDCVSNLNMTLLQYFSEVELPVLRKALASAGQAKNVGKECNLKMPYGQECPLKSVALASRETISKT